MSTSFPASADDVDMVKTGPESNSTGEFVSVSASREPVPRVAVLGMSLAAVRQLDLFGGVIHIAARENSLTPEF
jgi:hypothetical protein